MKGLDDVGVFLILLTLFFGMFPPLVHYSEAIDLSILQGRVFDKSTLQPIGNATIQVWDITSGFPLSWHLVQAGRTDPGGYYSIPVEGKFKSRVYAYYDDPSSPGFDYVPSFQDTFFSGEKNLTFMLKAGGSIIVEGEFRFVETSKPSESYVFTIIDPRTSLRPKEEGYVYDYESKPLGQDFLGLGPRHIVAAVDTPVDILVNASVMISDRRVYRTFRLSETPSIVVRKGQKEFVKLDPSLSHFNFDLVMSREEIARQSLDVVEQQGFYVSLERRDLTKVKELIDRARRELVDFSYDEGHADLREAYLGASEVSRRIDEIYVNASSSVAILTLFLAFTAVALSSIMFARVSLNSLGSCVLSFSSFAVLYFIYPGVRLIQKSSFLIDGGVSLSIALIANFVVLRYMDERFISIFSIAKQNLRRRKLRSLLTLISVIVLAMSFVTFTSFSTGYGLTSTSFKDNSDSPGILVRRPLVSDLQTTVPFLPLDTATISWLQGKQEVSFAAPKFENLPQLNSIGTLTSSNRQSRVLPLFGVLGIQPSVEARITHIDQTIIRGRYLGDDERDSVLISSNAAERLGIDIGEELAISSGFSTKKVFLVGIFDDSRFSRIVDIDAQPLIPGKLVLIPGDVPRILLQSCEPSELVVLNSRTSLEFFQFIPLSRVDIGLRNPDSTSSLARRIALERDLSVWASYGGIVQKMGLEAYLEAKGMPIMIPWIIVMLNVIITMLNSLFERRKEIAILSSIGLNPSHIGGIFMAEAAAIGVVGGGAGYLLGLSGYRATLALSLAVEVRQKVSAFWCLASVGVAVAAVLVGTFVALRSSVVITPSLLRRWTIDSDSEKTGGQWELDMPIKLHSSDVDALLSYLKERIREHIISIYSVDPDLVTKQTKESEMEDPEGQVKSISFNYFFGQSDYLGAFPFNLSAERKKGEETYTLKLTSRSGTWEIVQKRAAIIRMMIVDWNAQRK